ncbi:hypothetical protein NL676_015535 [Syzygium grande]|nr:hypothetical protein NL676_015535 [Syzygium grande]
MLSSVADGHLTLDATANSSWMTELLAQTATNWKNGPVTDGLGWPLAARVLGRIFRNHAPPLPPRTGLGLLVNSPQAWACTSQ